MELWHGGLKWEGAPEIRPPKKGRYECGPGIYLTTHYLRARNYAKGGKVVTRVCLADAIRWLEDAHQPLDIVVEFVNSLSGLKQRKALLDALHAVAERKGTPTIPLSSLVNLCINMELLSGKLGPKMAEWLVEQGVDASCHRPYGEEYWVVVFNPRIIKKHRVASARDVPVSDYVLPFNPKPVAEEEVHENP